MDRDLAELCLNPAINFNMGGVDDYLYEIEKDRYAHEYSESRDYYREAHLPYFGRFIDSLVEYQRKRIEEARTNYVETEVTRQVFASM
ncbi:MAG: hypothetical protein LLG06_17025, partial [Desulfobacteraceae bacterium]|nr:hypothetical protein [Desulfobacteraceae bacterium]